MEYLAGKTLGSLILRQGMRMDDTALGVAVQIARSRYHGTRRRIIHRDIKPSNVGEG